MTWWHPRSSSRYFIPDNYESACLMHHYFADHSNDGQHNQHWHPQGNPWVPVKAWTGSHSSVSTYHWWSTIDGWWWSTARIMASSSQSRSCTALCTRRPCVWSQPRWEVSCQWQWRLSTSFLHGASITGSFATCWWKLTCSMVTYYTTMRCGGSVVDVCWSSCITCKGVCFLIQQGCRLSWIQWSWLVVWSGLPDRYHISPKLPQYSAPGKGHSYARYGVTHIEVKLRLWES